MGKFDTEMTRKRGISISNTIYGSQTIAEYAFALLMDVCHHIGTHDTRIKTIDWSVPENHNEFCKSVTRQIELYDKTIGVIGLGAIGFAFAKMAQDLVCMCSHTAATKTGAEYDFIEQVSLDELLARSDFISCTRRILRQPNA